MSIRKMCVRFSERFSSLIVVFGRGCQKSQFDVIRQSNAENKFLHFLPPSDTVHSSRNRSRTVLVKIVTVVNIRTSFLCHFSLRVCREFEIFLKFFRFRKKSCDFAPHSCSSAIIHITWSILWLMLYK